MASEQQELVTSTKVCSVELVTPSECMYCQPHY